jgi:DNA mismatch repair protein MutS2
VIIYGSDTLNRFEFDKITEKVANFCRVRSSRNMTMAMAPIPDHDELLNALKQTDEFKMTLSKGVSFPDTFFEDFEAESDLLFIDGSVLNEQQFSRLRSASITVNNLLHFFNERKSSFPYLLLLTENVTLTKDIILLIDDIIDQHGIVKNNASPELQDIRNQLFSKRREADRKFRAFISDLKKRGYLRDNEENFYNNRRVLAVLSEYKRELRGIVHGKSETGRTTFIEPEALVELNNEVAELEQDELNEIRRLLRELTDALRKYNLLIRGYHQLLSKLDFIRAKAYFAMEINGNLPQINRNPVIALSDAVHPLLFIQNKAKQKAVIPLNLHLEEKKRILIISGPNAGGKSITLKTAGLLQLMLQSGMLVSAKEESQMCFFDNFLSDIGDSQSIENALSTYSSRLIRMDYFIRFAGKKSLILIDEFGTGTDPELGGAIAEVILEELNDKKAFGIFTTHYTNIKLLAENLDGVINGSMLFDPITLQPEYKLLSGQPGSSYTFEVAEKIGLPKSIIDRAKSKVSRDKLKLNSMLAGIHEQKHKLEKELKEVKIQRDRSEQANARYTQLSKKLEERLEKDKLKKEELTRITELGRRMQALAEEWENNKDKKAVIKKFVGNMTAEKKKKAAENVPAKVEKRKQALIEKLKKEIQIGSRVRMLKGRQIGIVEDIRKNIVFVNFNNLKATVAIENLELAEEKISSRKE